MFETIWTLFGTLIAVVAVIYLSYRFSRYLASGATKMGNSRYMKTIDRIVLGPDRMLLIVEIGGMCYLVGSTASGISLLKELSAEEMEAARQFELSGKDNPAGGMKSFQSVLQAMMPGKNQEKS